MNIQLKPNDRTHRTNRGLRVLLIGATAVALGLLCIAAAAEEFPEAVTTPTAEELDGLLKDKVFTVKLANGNGWRLDFRSGGYYYVNASGGFNGSGKWRVENGRLCTNLKTNPTECNDMRLQGSKLLLKRTNGDVVQFDSQ